MRNMMLMTNLPFNVKPIIDVTDKLPKGAEPWEVRKIRRSNGQHERGLRKREDIREIFLHHTAVEGNMHDHARYHIGRDRPGIAYHIIIDGNQAHQVNNLLSLTWHVKNHNYYSIGICVEGNFTKRDLTEVERKNLYAVVLSCMELFGISIDQVRGHDEVVKTQCPGYDMDRVRDDLFTLQQRMEYERSEEYAKETAFKVGNQTLYLFNLIEKGNEGQKKWATHQLLDLAPTYKEKGWI